MEKKKKKTLLIVLIVAGIAALLLIMYRRSENGVNYSSQYAGLIDMAGKATSMINDSLARINQSFGIYQQQKYDYKINQQQQAYDQLNMQRDRSSMYVRGF